MIYCNADDMFLFTKSGTQLATQLALIWPTSYMSTIIMSTGQLYVDAVRDPRQIRIDVSGALAHKTGHASGALCTKKARPVQACSALQAQSAAPTAVILRCSSRLRCDAEAGGTKEEERGRKQLPN